MTSHRRKDITRWNERNPVGTLVWYWIDGRKGMATGKARVESPAALLAGAAFVRLVGVQSAVALSNVDPVGDADRDAAPIPCDADSMMVDTDDAGGTLDFVIVKYATARHLQEMVGRWLERRGSGDELLPLSVRGEDGTVLNVEATECHECGRRIGFNQWRFSFTVRAVAN